MSHLVPLLEFNREITLTVLGFDIPKAAPEVS